jgi:dihydrodipicolinate synthase/N-acetylneuraminate lyase
MPTRNWRGSFAIPMTPFDERDRINEDVLAAEIDFCVASGVGGIVVPVMVSEFQALSEEERRLMIRIPVEVARARGARRVPIVANCAAINAPLAVSYAVYAEKIGADAVIAMPPYGLAPDFDTIYAYFKAISDAVTIPIWIQNAGLVPLSLDQVVKLCTEIEHVRWVKEEVSPSPQRIGQLIDRKCPAIDGVMGGYGGRYMITEWARGAAGVIHACQFCDVVQHIWELLDAGEEAAARALFELVLPGLTLEGLMGTAFAKEIMIRRGVFRNNRMRSQARPLDAHDLREIDRVWERIQPYLIWSK